MYPRQNTTGYIPTGYNQQYKFYLISEVNDFINMQIVSQMFQKYFKNGLNNTNRFLAQQMQNCLALISESVTRMIWFTVNLLEFEVFLEKKSMSENSSVCSTQRFNLGHT